MTPFMFALCHMTAVGGWAPPESGKAEHFADRLLSPFWESKTSKSRYAESMHGNAYAFGPFILDRERRQLTRKGEPLPIGHRGYVLLETLLDAAGEPVRKETLMERAWTGLVVEEGNLTVQISALRRQLGDDGNAIIVTVPRIGYRFVEPAKVAAPLSDRSGPPLIALLPFANLSNATDDSYFVDGVVADIITELSRFRAFAVISRTASFALRERGDSNPQAAARDLGVRYALEGSIRRMGDRLRVTAQFVDATTGAQLWAERYEGALTDIFSFQDRITESVVGVVEPEIRRAEIERARRKPTSSLDAYDLYLKALPLISDPGTSGHHQAIELLSSAAELDPGFALPVAYLAWTYEKRVSLIEPLGNNDRQNALDHARKALRIGHDDPVVRAICGWVLYRVADDHSMVQVLRQAVTDSPNNLIVLQLADCVIGLYGHAAEAREYSMRAYRLSPGAPEAYIFMQSIGWAELALGNNEAAVQWLLKALATCNDWLFTHIALVAAYVNLDRMDDAHAALKRVRDLSPKLTLKSIEANVAKRDAFADSVVPGLRKAGMPEY